MVRKLWHKTHMRRKRVSPLQSSQFSPLVFLPLWFWSKKEIYCISSYSFFGNYSFEFRNCIKFKQLPQYFNFYLIDWIFAAETIQGRKLFKGGNYMRKYGNRNVPVITNVCFWPKLARNQNRYFWMGTFVFVVLCSKFQFD